MFIVKYKPLNKYITRYMPPYLIKDRLLHNHSSNSYFIRRMFTDNIEKARKYSQLGHVTNSIGTNISNEIWEIIELEIKLKC